MIWFVTFEFLRALSPLHQGHLQSGDARHPPQRIPKNRYFLFIHNDNYYYCYYYCCCWCYWLLESRLTAVSVRFSFGSVWFLWFFRRRFKVTPPPPPFPPPSPFSGHVIHLGGSRAFSGPIKLCIVQVLPSGWDSPELPADWLPSSACCHPQGQGRLQREIVTGWHHIPVWDSSRFLKHWGIVAVVWSRSPSAPAIHTGCFEESWSLGRDRRRGPVEVTFSTGYSFWGILRDPPRGILMVPIVWPFYGVFAPLIQDSLEVSLSHGILPLD